jgi:hypothetical protein
MRSTIAIIVLSWMLGPSGVLAAGPTSNSPGNVRFAKTFNSAMDAFTGSPTAPQKTWMVSHYPRALVYTPYFDQRTAWFPNGWFYKDTYAIYPGTSQQGPNGSWILKDASGHNLYIRFACTGTSCSQYAADIGNQAWRDNWIAEARAVFARGSYVGLYMDDMNLAMDRISAGSQTVPAVPMDPRTGKLMIEADWRRYMAEFTEQVAAAFPDKEIVHNILWTVGTTDPFAQREMLAATVLGLEHAGTYAYGPMLTVIDWAHTHGRAVWYDAGPSTDADREFNLGTYFVMGSGADYIGNTPGTGGQPNDWWPGYDAYLGDAKGPRYTWNGLVRRDFTLGTVLVNQPGSSTVTASLGATYLDLTGAQRTSVTLGAAQGAVLRQAGTPPTAPPPTLLDVLPLSN